MENILLEDARSVVLEPADKKKLRSIKKYAKTITNTATLLGLSRRTMLTLMGKGKVTCLLATRDKIRMYELDALKSMSSGGSAKSGSAQLGKQAA